MIYLKVALFSALDSFDAKDNVTSQLINNFLMLTEYQIDVRN
jgi:hypothetical protein